MSVTSPQIYDEQQNAANAALPEVARSRTYVSFQTYVTSGAQPDVSRVFEASGTFDGRYLDQDRFVATRGRTPDPRRADAIVSWQATTIVGFRLVRGLPVGAALGRVVAVVRRQLDVVATPILPLAAIAGVAVGAALIANAVTAIPGRSARNVDPSSVLRPE